MYKQSQNGRFRTVTPLIIVGQLILVAAIFFTGFGVAPAHARSCADIADMLVSNQADSSVQRFDNETRAYLDAYIPAGLGGLSNPHGLAIGADGNLYVASVGTGEVLRYDLAGDTFMDVFATAPAGFEPVGLEFGPNGNLFASDGGRVAEFDGVTGAFLKYFVDFADNGGLTFANEGIVFGPDGNLYVASGSGEVDAAVKRYDGTTGAYMDDFITAGNGLNNAWDVVFGPDGNVYVTSYNSNQVLRYDGLTGTFIDVFVPAASGGLLTPTGMAFGPDGNLYIASYSGANSVHHYDGTTGSFMGTLTQNDPEERTKSIVFAPTPDCHDYGDAIDPTYPTLATSDGARHLLVPSLFLGDVFDDGDVDVDGDGQPTEGAMGDDIGTAGDDEDGIIFPALIACEAFDLTVTASAPGYLTAWIDWNGDGDWDDVVDGLPEHFIVDAPLNGGTTVLSLDVPCNATTDLTYARFRFSTHRGLSYTGYAPNGEVEDYVVQVEGDPTAVSFRDIQVGSEVSTAGYAIMAFIILITVGVVTYVWGSKRES